jgi:hypothetical protein
MRIYLTAGILLGLLAGCSSDQAPVADLAKAAAGNAKSAPAFTFRSPALSFASLPDRGELLAYEKGRQTKHMGAYTAYPVAISEAHALHAMQSGEMVLNAPNGEPIRLTYERHEENQDGNWTWIGRNAEGAEAILTFGEKAVFGVIPQGAADTLRLTMSAGRSWLVQTDRSKLAGFDGATRRKGGDQLVPPKLTSGGSASLAAMRGEPVTARASAAAAVVDVLLGYTNGFASQLGGQSQANTRLVNMVAITNQAYTNSGVNMRVRLVKTLQVNYADNTDNGDALEKLTGYKAGTGGGPITPDPAFNALRTARDESGADLVSLVRAFRSPENNGCGIAWLIGGDESGIVKEDAPFGYSVVSDGTDLDEGDGNEYFCREETLAHEMGHNMGQAHNEEDSESTGVHAYSYGYRESSSTGFYTVMAYPQEDSGQFSIRHFANPNVKYSNRVTGVANASDNVRSLNQTMPIVGLFRDTVINPAVVRNDVNGDGRSDVIFRNVQTGGNAIWLSANYSTQQSMKGVTDTHWQIVGTGDFDGDANKTADVLWRNMKTGANVIWKAAKYDSQQALTTVTDKAWTVGGVGDFDGDGKSDILWRNTVTGANAIWKSGNSATQQAVTAVAATAWVIAGVGDFDGDGRDDILWYTKNGGKSTIWKSGSSNSRLTPTAVSDTGWRIVGVGDFNGDGKSDMLWRHAATGKGVIWKSAVSTSQQALGVVNRDWSPVTIGDYDGDGRSDIFWRNTKNGKNVYWKGGSPSSQQSVTAITNLAWQVQY